MFYKFFVRGSDEPVYCTSDDERAKVFMFDVGYLARADMCAYVYPRPGAKQMAWVEPKWRKVIGRTVIEDGYWPFPTGPRPTDKFVVRTRWRAHGDEKRDDKGVATRWFDSIGEWFEAAALRPELADDQD